MSIEEAEATIAIGEFKRNGYLHNENIRLQNVINKAKKEIKKLKDELSDLNSEMKKYQNKIKSLEKKLEKSAMSGNKKKAKLFSKKITKIQPKIDAIELEKLDIKYEIDEQNKIIKAQEIVIDRLKKESNFKESKESYDNLLNQIEKVKKYPINYQKIENLLETIDIEYII